MVGYNYRMTDLAAAVVLPQLDSYAEQVARRRANAEALSERLAGLPGLALPRTLPGREHVWHQYTVRLTGEVARDEVAARLAELGIATGIYYPRPIHHYDAFREHPRVSAAPTPVAERVSATCLSLPVLSSLTADEVNRIADAMAKVLG
jgi:dTDP-4-amino-4,6-dideoxygalactose transaminase